MNKVKVKIKKLNYLHKLHKCRLEDTCISQEFCGRKSMTFLRTYKTRFTDSSRIKIKATFFPLNLTVLIQKSQFRFNGITLPMPECQELPLCSLSVNVIDHLHIIVMYNHFIPSISLC